VIQRISTIPRRLSLARIYDGFIKKEQSSCLRSHKTVMRKPRILYTRSQAAIFCSEQSKKIETPFTHNVGSHAVECGLSRSPPSGPCVAALITTRRRHGDEGNADVLLKPYTQLENQIVTWHCANEHSRKLARMPGIGVITASAMVASLGDAKSCKNGPTGDYLAWTGAEADSSGRKTLLLGMSKRGDSYIRALLILGGGNRHLDSSPVLR
jgi:hypothetical protein